MGMFTATGLEETQPRDKEHSALSKRRLGKWSLGCHVTVVSARVWTLHWAMPEALFPVPRWSPFSSNFLEPIVFYLMAICLGKAIPSVPCLAWYGAS